SSAVVMIPVSALIIDSPEARQMAHLGSGPSRDDVRTIQARMLGPEVLDASQHPTISFKAASARESRSGRLLVTGDLALHGHTHRISVPVNYRRDASGAYVFDGNFTIRQTDFGIKPETAGGGTVKVKDEVQIRFRISLVPAAL
ncbi:MAG: YceI family protein, partial [Acidobacteria bacterium]|nr:YceI family protein [Acidobacteriota bacterium]